jgi:predicted ester cyclase
MGPIPANGGAMDVTATSVYRVNDGTLTEHWGETDSLTLMQQLGVVPAPDPPPGA